MDSKTIGVLNHGIVRLVDSMPAEPGKGDLAISRSARVSYDAPPREQDAGLIKYLWENGHTTPFESVTLTFEVKAPIFVLRQWHRHRTQSYNELSARYRPLPEEWYVPPLDQITTQSTDNKQMRTSEQHPEADKMQHLIHQGCKAAYHIYEQLIEAGCPRELARGVLPVNMYSHMFTTMNLLNCFRFMGERLHPHAQYEIRVYAMAMVKLVEQVAPIATGVFMDKLQRER